MEVMVAAHGAGGADRCGGAKRDVKRGVLAAGAGPLAESAAMWPPGVPSDGAEVVGLHHLQRTRDTTSHDNMCCTRDVCIGHVPLMCSTPFPRPLQDRFDILS